ncbi:hypothetical protein CR194_09965 [Salipaludibacillus keqinensis]|uniref:Calcineurin-like phosphoesterase domain-containing protein n=1 Tax=Salipaludibacillus keqinensis TaxID=2045207 RepID=A0A323TIU2_9BACI|nr:bis(5'-nucleosyl)-tetraphosphatase PrpE [Salipaludibacillus keqinensis]PYZ93487.1 hypothetical protein CR194_09965 [Salipaludibacillus keqinensis]
MNKYDVIGDVHGCYEELIELLSQLGYSQEGRHLTHPEGRKPVFLGDLTDRGPSSVKTIEEVANWVFREEALYCPGNHCDKLYRYFLGRKVMIKHGLETTVEELEQLSPSEYKKVSALFIQLYEQSPLYLELDDQQLIVAHAGIRPDYIGKNGGKVKTFVLYGDITGEKHEDGRPVRRDWAAKHHFHSLVVYGHTPVSEPRWLGETVNIDTGCVFGGSLTALRWPERSTQSVPSKQPHIQEKFQSFD